MQCAKKMLPAPRRNLSWAEELCRGPIWQQCYSNTGSQVELLAHLPHLRAFNLTIIMLTGGNYEDWSLILAFQWKSSASLVAAGIYSHIISQCAITYTESFVSVPSVLVSLYCCVIACRPNMVDTIWAFHSEYYLWYSDRLKFLSWLAAWNPLYVIQG